jgi:hypothetical protein
LAEAYTNIGQDKIFIPIQCQWKRELRSSSHLYSTFDGIKSNVYQLSADDLGYVIIVQAKIDEVDYQSTAIGKFGPISLDIETRKSLDSILVQRNASFIVFSHNEERREYQLRVSQSETSLFDDKGECIESTQTTIGTVSVYLHLKDSKRFKIILNTTRTLSC